VEAGVLMTTGEKKEESELVRACCGGSREAWDEFYRRFFGLIRTVVQRRSHVFGPDLEDAIQEVFLHLMRSLHGYDDAYPLSKFVCIISERVATDQHRFNSREKRRGQTISLNQDHSIGDAQFGLCSEEKPQDEQLADVRELMKLRILFKTLSEKCREILRLRYEHELPFKEIGNIMGKTENTVTVQARRCLDQLRGLYRQGGDKGDLP